MKLCMRYGPDVLPEQWRDDPDTASPDGGKYKTFFSPAMFAMALDEFVLDAGVEILFDTQVVAPVMEQKHAWGCLWKTREGVGFTALAQSLTPRGTLIFSAVPARRA